MAKELVVGIAIGAALQGSYLAAFGNAKRTLDTLGAATNKLKQQHTQMGEAMQRSMGRLSGGTLAAINRDYEKLGRTIDALKKKQEALAASMARGVALKNARQEHWAGMKESAATAVAVGAPFLASVKQASRFESDLRDIAITGNLKAEDEIALGATLRESALRTNQGHAAIMLGVNTLVAAGMEAKRAGQYSTLLGRTATATNADMKDLAGMVYAFSETLGIKGEQAIKEAFSRAAFGGKLGRFELKDMAKALPEMTAAFASKGIMGQDALTQIIASLEVGREGAGSGDEAVTNLRNWLSHMNTKHTIDAYSKAGVDYQKSMQNLVADGYSSYEASLEIAQKFIAARGDGFMKQWKEAGAKGDADAQRKLMESFGLNEVFTDIQTINHLLAMRQGWDKYQQNKKEMSSQKALGTIDEDFMRRSQTMQKAWERFTTQVSDVAITIGGAFLPALSDVLDGLGPTIRGFGEWAKANPVLLRGIVGVVGGLLAMRTGIFALRFLGNFMFLAPANSVITAWGVLSSRFTLFRALVVGGASRFSLLLQFFGMGASRAAALAGWFGRMGTATLSLGRMLAAGLLTGLRLVTQAVFWLGRAFLLNPIGLIITGIALGAYLIYRHWSPIKAFFLGLWSEVKTAFAGGIGGVTKLILNWSPLGLFYRAFAGVMKYFGIDMPQSFADFGANLIGGLVGGIKARIGAAKDTIVSFGKDVKGWFADTLGIKSPSRVFMGFGDNVAQGLGIGIDRSAGQASRAASGMASDAAAVAKDTIVRFGKDVKGLGIGIDRSAGQASRATSGMASDTADTTHHIVRGSSGSGGNSAPGTGGMTIHFSPQITVQGSAAEGVKGQVQQALQISLHELEKMMTRVMEQRSRRSYAGS